MRTERVREFHAEMPQAAEVAHKKSAAFGGELAEGRVVTPSRPGTKTAGSSR
jgi:hypothetical protein